MKRNSRYLAFVAGLALAAAIAQAHEPAGPDESYTAEEAIVEQGDSDSASVPESSPPAELGMWADESGPRDEFGIRD